MKNPIKQDPPPWQFRESWNRAWRYWHPAGWW